MSGKPNRDEGGDSEIEEKMEFTSDSEFRREVNSIKSFAPLDTLNYNDHVTTAKCWRRFRKTLLRKLHSLGLWDRLLYFSDSPKNKGGPFPKDQRISGVRVIDKLVWYIAKRYGIRVVSAFFRKEPFWDLHDSSV